MYASGSTDNGDESDGGSTDNGDESDGGSTDNGDASDSGPTGTNNALPSGPTGTNNALPSGPTGTNNALPSGFTENNAAPPSGPTGTNDALNPLTSGFRIEGNNTGSTNNETAANFANNILAVHNQERAAVSVPLLVWSDKLAADAKTWADYVAPTHDYRHDTEHLGNLGEGENLEAFVFNLSDPPSTAKLMAGWVNEKNYYQQWVTNSLPKTANWTGWSPGHYNQIVWNTTKEVGCATGFTSGLSPDTRGVYLVCRYSPPGNYPGQTPY
jgi:uncharacterized protein YkwD